MENITILDWISTISAIAIPFLMVVITFLFTQLRSREEKAFEVLNKLQDDRIDVYNTILEPYIAIATPIEILRQERKYQGKDSGEVAVKLISKPAYKRAEFKLFLMGSDEVVRAYNNLKKFYYSNGGSGTTEGTEQTYILMATLLTEIRRNLGYEKTKITHKDALWWFVRDVDKYFKEDD